MLDFRINTFLELCRLKNYTKTAEYLHITQPAVTQHIQYLEREYGVVLFERNTKNMKLTTKGETFYWCSVSMEANSRKIYDLMQREDLVHRHFRFGVSLSIGEYMMPHILSDYLELYPKHRLEMLVENTEMLVGQLNKGEIDFAIVEGSFDKDIYSHVFFSNERFIAVSSHDFPMEEELTMDKIIKYPVIIREKGSGTRMILENILKGYNINTDQFHWVSEIGNFKTIKHLVGKGLGITFLYEPVVREELAAGTLKELPIRNFDAKREFNFIYLKDSIFEKEYQEFCKFCLLHK